MRLKRICDNADRLATEVVGFPALADFVITGTVKLLSGVPVVWAFNRHVTGIVVRAGRDAEVFIAQTGMTSEQPTQYDNVKAERFFPFHSDTQPSVIDDRWRIDLRCPLGRAFMETT